MLFLSADQETIKNKIAKGSDNIIKVVQYQKIRFSVPFEGFKNQKITMEF